MTDRPSSSDSAQSGPEGAAPGSGGGEASTTAPRGSAGAPPLDEPPGLRTQFGRTKDAAFGLLAAHIDLAKAEFSEIAGEIKKAAALGGAALGMLFVAATIFTVGSVLWLDEWAFGSIGWGVLHGTELFVALAILLALAIVNTSPGRLAGGFVIGLIVAAAVFVVFLFNVTNRISAAIIDGLGWLNGRNWPTGQAIAQADRPILFDAAVFALLLGLFGLFVGLIVGRGFGRLALAIALAIILGVVGVGIGAFLGVPMSVGAALAVAIAVFLVAWPVTCAILILRNLDTAKLKDRFVPAQTIETTKETIEWVRAQTPLGRKS